MELVRLATELKAVEGEVQTECNELRDLFARTTAAVSGSGLQHDRTEPQGGWETFAAAVRWKLV